jgi:hypothetical protein
MRAKLEERSQANLSPSSLPDVAAHVGRYPRHSSNNNNPTQSMLMDDLHAKRAMTLSARNPYMAAHIKMADAPGANAWLHAEPTEPGLRIKSDIYMRLLQWHLHRLRLPADTFCLCSGRAHKNKPNPNAGRSTPLLANDFDSIVHLATCKCGGGGIFTHDTLLRFLALCIREMPGILSRCEVNDLIKNGRLDLLVHTIGKAKGDNYDVSVSNPFARSHIAAAQVRTLATADLRESEKDAKWKARSEEAGLDFTALSFEISGGRTKNTQRVLRAWAGRANSVEAYQPVNHSAPTRMAYWDQRISVLLMRCLDRAIQHLIRLIERNGPQRNLPPTDYPPSAPSSQHQTPTSLPASPLLPPRA